MTELTDRGLYPFRLSWPQKPKEPILVFAATSAVERKAWVKALEGAIDTIARSAPTFGYLTKKAGRRGGLLAFGWHKRWFELLQASEGTPASFSYYDTEEGAKAGAQPKGQIVLNARAVLLSSASLATKAHEHVFAISSQGATDPKPITTTLAAESSQELDRWTSAVERALHSFRPTAVPRTKLSEEETALHKKSVAQLRLMLEYMGVDYDKATTDKGALALEVMRQRQIQSLAKHGSVGASNGELQRKLKKDEARLMQRDVEELRALLNIMEVDYNQEIDSKERLIALIINQKRVELAASTAQRVYRAHSCNLSRRESQPLDVA